MKITTIIPIGDLEDNVLEKNIRLLKL